MPRKRSEEQKNNARAAMALEQNSATVAEQTGIPARTIRHWRKQPMDSDQEAIWAQKRAAMLTSCWEVAESALAQMKDTIKEANAREAAAIFQTVVSQALALRADAMQASTGDVSAFLRILPTEIRLQLAVQFFDGAEDADSA